MTHSELLKKLNLRFNENLHVLDNADMVTVTRNTKGNFLTGTTQKMTVREAVNFGAWDTCGGTMEYSVKTESGTSVTKLAQFVYAISQ